MTTPELAADRPADPERRPAAIPDKPGLEGLEAKWVARWAARADDAALGLGTILEAEAGVPADDVAAHARTAREQFLAGLLETAGQHGTGQAG